MSCLTPLAEPITYAPGSWPITLLRGGQCRFACTPFNAPKDAHRFCGEPTTGIFAPYCDHHRSIVYRTASAEIEAEEAEAEGIAA